MKVNSQKIARRMEDMGISRMRMTVLLQITPVYMNKIMQCGECCEEIVNDICDILHFNLNDIATA